MNTTERLMTRLAIEELNIEFAYRVDHDLTHTVADLFTLDGSYGRADGGARSSGQEAIRKAYALRHELGPRTARHIFTNLRLEYDSVDRVRGTTIMLLFAENGLPPLPAEPLAVSDFEDVYVRGTDAQWRYESRTIRSLFRDASNRPVVLPLGQTKAQSLN
jgi:SnoaL-like domain